MIQRCVAYSSRATTGVQIASQRASSTSQPATSAGERVIIAAGTWLLEDDSGTTGGLAGPILHERGLHAGSPGDETNGNLPQIQTLALAAVVSAPGRVSKSRV